MPLTIRRLVLAGALALAVPPALPAQIDYRNLDDDRPLATEDAYPVERYAFEILLPYSFEDGAAGDRLHSVTPELAYGIIRNGQVGIKAPFAGRTAAGTTDWGLAGLRLFGLYNLNTDSPWLPALSARGDLLLPAGALAGDATRLSLKAIATRNFGRTRVHLNAQWTVGRETDLAAVEPGSRWRHSLAVDRTLFRHSLLLAGEVTASRAVRGAPVEVNLGAGARLQWTPTTVLDLGVRRRLRRDGPDLGLTVGVSHTFALAGLMPAGR